MAATVNFQRLAARAARLHAGIARAQEKLEAMKAQLVAGGVADYGVCRVIPETTQTKANADAMPEAVELCPKPIFGKLFKRKVVFAPAKNFVSVAKALLAPGKAEKLIALFQTPVKAHVRFA